MTVVSLEQTAPVPGRDAANVADIHARVERARVHDVDLVVLPELAHSGYVTEPARVIQAAQHLDGPYIGSLVSRLRCSTTLVATGLCERDGSDYFNSVVLLGADGPVLHYRKTHLFDAELDVYTPGATLPVVQTAHGAIGVCVCYDLRFVEVMRLLALQGAEIVVAPAAWVQAYDPAGARQPAGVGDGLVPQALGAAVQANLNQVAVVAVSQVGTTDEAALLGGSVAVDGYGRLIVPPLPTDRPATARADVDLEADVRSAYHRSPRIHPRDDRRRDLYSLTGVQEGS